MQLAPVLGVPHEVVGEGLAGAEHAEQPHRGALVVDERAQQGALVGPLVGRRVGEPHQAGERLVGVGGAGQQRDERLGGRRPSSASPAGRRVASAKPEAQQAALGTRRRAAHASAPPAPGPRARARAGRSGRRRPPGRSRRPAPRRLGEQPLAVEAARRCGARRRRRPRRPGSGGVDLGVPLHAPDGRREAHGLHVAVRGRGRGRRRRRARGCTTSSFQKRPAAARGGVSRRGRRLGDRPSGQPRSTSPTCRPCGLRPTSPPKATAQSWWPRQTPRVGTRRSAASRISRARPASATRRRRRASIEPPSTSRPS